MPGTLTAPQFLETGLVARELAVSVEAVRDWERRGVIAPPIRTAGGRRLFTREAVEAMRQAREARKRADDAPSAA